MEYKMIVFLQNAWYKDGQPRNRRQWLRDLFTSQTGKRLMEMLPTSSVWYDNASPETGSKSNDAFEPDLEHMLAVIYEAKPKVILACGKPAQKAMKKIKTYIPVVNAPHPAWRQLTKKQTGEIRQELYDLLLAP